MLCVSEKMIRHFDRRHVKEVDIADTQQQQRHGAHHRLRDRHQRRAHHDRQQAGDFANRLQQSQFTGPDASSSTMKLVDTVINIEKARPKPMADAASQANGGSSRPPNTFRWRTSATSRRQSPPHQSPAAAFPPTPCGRALFSPSPLRRPLHNPRPPGRGLLPHLGDLCITLVLGGAASGRASGEAGAVFAGGCAVPISSRSRRAFPSPGGEAGSGVFVRTGEGSSGQPPQGYAKGLSPGRPLRNPMDECAVSISSRSRRSFPSPRGEADSGVFGRNR